MWVGVRAQPARLKIGPVAEAPKIRTRRLRTLIQSSLSALGSEIKRRVVQGNIRVVLGCTLRGSFLRGIPIQQIGLPAGTRGSRSWFRRSYRSGHAALAGHEIIRVSAANH